MKLTKHAEKRMRQRGFPGLAISIIEHYGTSSKAPGGATKIMFGRKEHQSAVGELKRTIQILDKVKNGTMIVSEKDVLTVYKH